MECEQKIERPECDSSATSSIIAPTSDDFPDLSAEMLTAVTKRALLAIPLTFPGDSIFDTDVVRHYEKLASVGHDQYPSGKAGVCDALSDLGMSSQRLSMIAGNFEAIAKSYGLDTADELWDLYPPEVLMFWSLQSALDKAAWAASRRDQRGGAEEGGSGGRDQQIGEEENSGGGGHDHQGGEEQGGAAGGHDHQGGEEENRGGGGHDHQRGEEQGGAGGGHDHQGGEGQGGATGGHDHQGGEEQGGAGGGHDHQGGEGQGGAAGGHDRQGDNEKGGGSGGRDRQEGRKKGRSRKGRKKTTKSDRDTKYGRFPQHNERFFASAKDYMKADSQYADWDHISVEYPESDEEALAQEDEADLEDADLEADDLGEDDLGDDDLGVDDLGDDDLGDDDLGVDDLGDKDEAWWDIKWNSTTRTVYHGMPITEYRNLIQAGRWSGRPCRDRGELAPCPAVYFATNKAFALFFAAFKAGLSSDCLNTSVGVVIETPLPPCRYALIRPKFREEFSVLNRMKILSRNVHRPRPPTEVIVSGFLERWRKKYKENTELADVVRLSHQLAVVMPEDKLPMEAIINSMPSKVAIVGFSAEDVEC
jgi:hypothetical protein